MVDELQKRLNALGKDAAKPLALLWIGKTSLSHGKPLMGSENGKGAVMVDPKGAAITDEGVGEQDQIGATH